MKVPAAATPDIQQSFREVWEFLERWQASNVDLKGRRFINAGASISPGDFVTRFEFDQLQAQLKALEEKVNGQSVP